MMAYNDYYPDTKIYEVLTEYARINDENYWRSKMEKCLTMLNRKLGHPRLTNLQELWYSGFEDLELKKLERSLLIVQVLLDDIEREEKEFSVWKTQYKDLKDLLCEVGDVLDDMALRASLLKQLFQSPPVTHPYLMDKLAQINNLIQGLNNLTAEIRSLVLPEINSRKSKPQGPSGADDKSEYYSFIDPQENFPYRPAKTIIEERVNQWNSDVTDNVSVLEEPSSTITEERIQALELSVMQLKASMEQVQFNQKQIMDGHKYIRGDTMTLKDSVFQIQSTMTDLAKGGAEMARILQEFEYMYTQRQKEAAGPARGEDPEEPRDLPSPR